MLSFGVLSVGVDAKTAAGDFAATGFFGVKMSLPASRDSCCCGGGAMPESSRDDGLLLVAAASDSVLDLLSCLLLLWCLTFFDDVLKNLALAVELLRFLT